MFVILHLPLTDTERNNFNLSENKLLKLLSQFDYYKPNLPQASVFSLLTKREVKMAVY